MYFVEKTKGINFIKRFDYLLFSCTLLLSLIGLLALSSATHSTRNTSMMSVQIISLVIGISVSLIVGFLDYKDFKTLGLILYGISVMLLLIVLIAGEGYQAWGSRSWLKIPFIGLGFQPSELAKITVILVTAMYLERIKEGHPDSNNGLKLIGAVLIPIGLVLLQPDFGTAMVFIFMLIVIAFVYGVGYKYFLAAFGAFAAAAPLLWFFALNDKRRSRIITFLYPESDPMGAGFQVIRSKMAIGSGQLFGKGLYNGIQTQSNGVPVKESDFIFTVIGEEFGFIGSAIVIIIIGILLMRCFYIAMNSRDLFGALIVSGLTGMLGFHFIENIGMCLGLLPVTGIPLPFISQGGSAMITNYFAVGLILSVSIRRRRALFNSE